MKQKHTKYSQINTNESTNPETKLRSTNECMILISNGLLSC